MTGELREFTGALTDYMAARRDPALQIVAELLISDLGPADLATAARLLREATGPQPLPAGHGPNHIDSAGHAVHVTSGVRVPGCVTCEAGTEVAG